MEGDENKSFSDDDDGGLCKIVKVENDESLGTYFIMLITFSRPCLAHLKKAKVTIRF